MRTFAAASPRAVTSATASGEEAGSAAVGSTVARSQDIITTRVDRKDREIQNRVLFFIFKN
jgi:hypothetical protein